MCDESDPDDLALMVTKSLTITSKVFTARFSARGIDNRNTSGRPGH